ncbi:MAG: sulfatase [Gemmatimonadetes bacterium]|nr:sulfatase [Gemmatimonadota bacterium]
MQISRRKFLAGSATAAAAFYLTGCGTRRAAAQRPNVVFILTDDQRWDTLSVLPDAERFFPALKTPHMDRLANEGVRFANAFCTWSLCSPSRASFLSGTYPQIHGVRNNFTHYPAERLPSYHTHLKSAGYQTAYVGKWHMGEGDDSHRPPFDYWASHAGQGHYDDTEFNISRAADGTESIDSVSFDVQGNRQVIDGYYTNVVTQLAVDWIKNAKGPFSLQIGHKAPHGKWIPEPKYANLYSDLQLTKPTTASLLTPGLPEWVGRRVATWHGIDGPLYETHDYQTFIKTYHQTIPSVDDSIGAVYEALRAKGELENTIIVFAGDNGFLLGEKASIDKRTAWEESIRIPLLIRYPEGLGEGKVIEDLVMNMDVAPTVLDLAGIENVEPRMQGRSTRQLADGNAEGWRQSIYYQYNFEKEFPYTPNVRSVRTADWKYIHYPNGEGHPETELAELYHLAEDPKEQRNLINDAAHAEKLAELKAELRRLQQDTGAVPDVMPANPQLSFAMPDAAIR